jgi:hypothetical protein
MNGATGRNGKPICHPHTILHTEVINGTLAYIDNNEIEIEVN